MLEWLFGKKKEEDVPKPKPSADEAAEDKWKYDFIVQFLSSPLWKTSVLDFVDYHCVVFDNEEENKFEYTIIHKKFKELVASLFDGMMQEVGLDEEKLAELLDKGFDSKHKKIFNQLLLADDFLKFKQIMVNRNKILEAEAIKSMHEQAQVKKEEKPTHKGNSTIEERALRQSVLSEKERMKKIQEQEEEQLRKVIELSKIQAEESAMIKNLEQKVHQKQELEKVNPPVTQDLQRPHPQEYLNSEPQALIKSLESTEIPSKKKNSQPLDPLPPLRQQRKIQEPLKWQQPKEEQSHQEHLKEEYPKNILAEFAVEEKTEIIRQPEIEPQQERKKRLLEQRERIRRKKEEQRKTQLAEEEGKVPIQTIVLQDDGIHETQIGVVDEKKVSNTEVDRRRELMKKIKNRIIDDL